MSTVTPNRTCGSCGAPVASTDVTCPQCGALLAAYEAPRGSEATPSAEPVAEQAPTSPVSVTREVSATRTPPTSRSGETVAATSAPPPVATTSASPPKPRLLASSRKKAQPIPPREEPVRQSTTRPATRPPRPVATPPRSDQRSPLSTREIASTVSSFGKLALGVLMILVFIGILDVNLIPILVLGVVMLSLLGIMRSAAKASGRKTTSMHDPRRRR